MRLFLVYCICSFIVISCSKKRIDTTSQKDLVSSVRKVSEMLNKSERQQFKRALYYLAFDELKVEKFNDYSFEEDLFTPEFLVNIRDRINQKTAEEIVNEALEIQKQLQKRWEKHRESRIEELEEKLSTNPPETPFIKAELKRLKNSSLSIPKNDSLGNLPTIVKTH